MKRILYSILSLAMIAALFGCNKTPETNAPDQNKPGGDGAKSVATVSQAALVDAVADWYAVWEDATEITETMKVGDKELTLPQYTYAMAKLLVNLADGKSEDIDVLSYKAADHPERDSYDAETVKVVNGPKDGKDETEDLKNIATRMMATMADKGTVPNQTLIYRGTSPIAFSTNRATVCFARAIAGYKKDGKLPAEVETTYLSAASTMKGFAQEFVKALDVWDKTIGNVSADASMTSTIKGAWQNVHFVPIPWSGGDYPDGQDQYDPKYQIFSIEVAGQTYTAAECWDIALRGILDLITVEGSTTYQEKRNEPVHHLGNGKSLSMPIPVPNEQAVWGQYPWYEQESNVPYPLSPSTVDMTFLMRHSAWALTRAFYNVGAHTEPLGKIGNFLNYGTDPDNAMVVEGYEGFCSAMRAFLIAARFYKYLLDNNITDNVYDAMKDVRISADLYGIAMPDIVSITDKVTIGDKGKEVKATFNANSAWTASASEAWIHVDPTSGEGGKNSAIMISADPNSGDQREGKVTVKGGNNEIEIAVVQAAYVETTDATLKDFAQEFVKALDVWDVTVGTVESDGQHLMENGMAWENVHFIPIGKVGGPYDNHAGNQHDDMYPVWKLNIKGVEFTSSQAWEIAFRGLFNLVTTEGEDDLPNIDNRNTTYTLANNGSMLDPMPEPSPANKWGGTPWYEADKDGGHLVTYNGGAITDVDVNFMVKLGRWHVVRSFIKTNGNNPLENVGNFQQFGSDNGTIMLDGYEGLISPMRELLILARIYKYILDNNIESNVYDAIKDQRFDFDLYNQGAVVEKKATIADFAKEFAKVSEKWNSTIGEITVYDNGGNKTYAPVHYVPADFTITVKGKSYDKYQQHLMAMHALQALNAGGKLSDELDAPEAYKESDARYDEFGGPLGEGKFAKVDLLLNATERLLNYAKSNDGKFPDAFGYPRDPVNYLSGTVSVERFYLTLARWFKHVSDKNITENVIEATKDVEISTDLYGEVTLADATLKEFAQEFVKGLEVWEKTVGTVESEGVHTIEKGTAWENVHFIPVGKTGGDYDNHEGNQHDPKWEVWKLNINGVEVTSGQAWEIAIRGLLDMVTAEGQEGLNAMAEEGRNMPWTLQNGKKFSTTKIADVPESHGWNGYPWYEWGKEDPSHQRPVRLGDQELTAVDLEFILKCTSWHVVRAYIKGSKNGSPLERIGNFQEFGNWDTALMLQKDGVWYDGLISPMREMLIVMRVYKYLLDNNVDGNVYDAIKNQTFDFDLYGI